MAEVHVVGLGFVGVDVDHGGGGLDDGLGAGGEGLEDGEQEEGDGLWCGGECGFGSGGERGWIYLVEGYRCGVLGEALESPDGFDAIRVIRRRLTVLDEDLYLLLIPSLLNPTSS